MRILLSEWFETTHDTWYMDLKVKAYTIFGHPDKNYAPTIVELGYSKRLPLWTWDKPILEIKVRGGSESGNQEEANKIFHQWEVEEKILPAQWFTESPQEAYRQRLDGEYHALRLAHPFLMWQYHYLLAVLDAEKGKRVPSELHSRFYGFVTDQYRQWENVFGTLAVGY